MNDTVLQVQGLRKNYPAFTLSEVSFSLEAGRIMGFIGRNGAGKTTTLKSILGLVHPDAGEIRYFGLPFAQNEQRIKEQIGYAAGGHQLLSAPPGRRDRPHDGLLLSRLG